LGYGSFPLTDDAVRQADLVLALGCRFSEFTSKRWTLLGEGTRLIHVDIDTIELGRVYQPDVAIHADAALTARALVAAMEDKEARPTVESHPADLRRRFLEQALAIPGPDTPPNTVGSADLVRALQAVVSRDDVLFVQDVHTFGPWLARHLQVNRSGSYFGAAGGAMGWGFPAAMGVALARPDQRVVAVSGDGSFWMVAQELETCVREGIPVVNVVVNNFAYDNTRDRQRFSHSERYLGVFLDNPDMAAFARLMGAHGERVADPRDLEQALHTAIASELPSLVEIVQDQWEGLPPGLTPLAAH
jgi:acetolactate synthase-1/2/3 large subunit